MNPETSAGSGNRIRFRSPFKRLHRHKSKKREESTAKSTERRTQSECRQNGRGRPIMGVSAPCRLSDDRNPHLSSGVFPPKVVSHPASSVTRFNAPIRPPRPPCRLSSLEPPSVCPACIVPCLTREFCLHCSQSICPVCIKLHRTKVQNFLGNKLATLRASWWEFASLKASLLRLKEQRVYCKEKLARRVSSAADDLRSQAACTFEKTQMDINRLSAVRHEIFSKLGRDLIVLMQQRSDFVLVAGSGLELEDNASDLKEFGLNAKALLKWARQFVNMINALEDDAFFYLRITPEFEEISIQLEEFRLFVSHSNCPLAIKQ